MNVCGVRDGLSGDMLASSRRNLVLCLCQLTCQSTDMASFCGIPVHLGKHIYMNNLSKSTRPRDMLVFTPQPLRAVGVLFSPMVSGWAGGRREIVCPGCISETVRCRKFILGRDIGWGV